MYIHGMTGSRTYRSWTEMRARSMNPKSHNYKYYGGRGIRICDRWRDFLSFFKDMGERPLNTTLDRINNNGDYKPSNCQWADKYQQARNKRNSRIIEYNGESRSMAEWAEIYSIKIPTLWRRLRDGLAPPECFLPVGEIPRGTLSHQNASARFLDKAVT